MTLADFEARYARDGDPWGYGSRAYERAKYAATLAACGPGPFQRALELGASIGIFSAQLAPRCRALVTIDAAPTAVRAARERLAGFDHVELVLGAIPEAVPAGPYDLVVASEILYYLDAGELDATLDALEQRTGSGTRIVAVHWRPAGPERPLDAAAAHARVAALPWLAHESAVRTPDYLLDTWVRR